MTNKPYPAPFCPKSGESDSRATVVYIVFELAFAALALLIMAALWVKG